MGKFINTCDAAHFLSISPRTLEKLRTSGQGPAFYKLRRRVVYRVSDLEQWARAGRHQSTNTEGRVESTPARQRSAP
jgi:hypothetical protein